MVYHQWSVCVRRIMPYECVNVTCTLKLFGWSVWLAKNTEYSPFTIVCLEVGVCCANNTWSVLCHTYNTTQQLCHSKMTHPGGHIHRRSTKTRFSAAIKSHSKMSVVDKYETKRLHSLLSSDYYSLSLCPFQNWDSATVALTWPLFCPLVLQDQPSSIHHSPGEPSGLLASTAARDWWFHSAGCWQVSHSRGLEPSI